MSRRLILGVEEAKVAQLRAVQQAQSCTGEEARVDCVSLAFLLRTFLRRRLPSFAGEAAKLLAEASVAKERPGVGFRRLVFATRTI